MVFKRRDLPEAFMRLINTITNSVANPCGVKPTNDAPLIESRDRNQKQ